MNPIIMHVNYCEQGQTPDEICRKAVEWGFDGVEFRGKRAGVNETTEEYLQTLESAVSKSKLHRVVFGYYTDNLLSSDKSAREEATEKAVAFFRLASQMFRLDVCNVLSGALVNNDKSIPAHEYDKHGSAAATPDHWVWAADAWRIICSEAEKYNIRLAFETHMNFIHDLPKTALKLTEMIDNKAAGVNFDYGNIVYFNNPLTIKESIDYLDERLYYIHLKNSIGLPDGRRFPVGLGDGTINHREYLRYLMEKGYKGPICIEGPRPGDREHFAKQDLAYFKEVIREISFAS